MRTPTLALAFLVLSGALPAAAQVPLTGIAKVAVGSSHACALTQAGAVLCWGNNSSGQLGTGGTEERRTPVDIAALRSGVVDIAAGGTSTCALTQAGDVKCWGANNSGQIGDGTTTLRTTPVQVIAGATSITANNSSACAVMAGGQAKCWGLNSAGQLGDNSTTQRNSPTDVVGLANAARVEMGLGHACAVTTAGGVKCWGNNVSGMLGDNSTTQRLTPVDVSGLTSGVAFVDAGNSHSCALRLDGTAACWGSGASNQIGDGNASTGNRLTPVNVAGGLTFSSLRVGANSTCAVTTAGAAVCWGQGGFGVLGNGNAAVPNVNTPSAVVGLASGVTSIDTNGANACAITGGSNALYCWGNNANGQLGTNNFNREVLPSPVSGGLLFQQIAAGAGHSCGLTTDGGAYCWGAGASVGHGSTSLRSEPTAVVGLGSGVTAISVGGTHTCALTTSGGVKCWGLMAGAGLGDGTATTTRTSPVDVLGITSGASAMAAGGQHSCAIVSGAVKCWGTNGSGQLGNNTTTPSNQPVDVTIAPGVTFVALALGNNHTCALDSAQSVWCWGQNTSGQLGINSTTASSVPVQLTLPGPAVRIVAGFNHTCAFVNANEPYCWGVALGLGNNASVNSLVPVPAFGYGALVTDGGAGGLDFTCLHGADDTLRCSGRNQYGMLGNGTVANATTPVFVQGGPAMPEWAQVAAGNDHACAITRSNTAWCWGRYDAGQLGNGSVGYAVVPVAVTKFDTSPTPFSFDPQVDVQPNSARTSNPATIDGIDPGTPISIVGGSYQINCTGAFITTTASINPGSTLCLRHTSAAALATSTTTRVFIGDAEAVFTSTTRSGWLLTVSRSGAPGTSTVTSDPAGIDCNPTCTAMFAPAVPVTLTAVASSTTRHTGWTGAACAAAGAAPCTLTLTADTSVTAAFVGKTSQTITFAALPNKLTTDPPFTVSATASSGLAVTFSSITLPVCTVAGDQVTLLTPGTCTIRASQSGDGTFLAANDANRSFTVSLPTFTLQVNRTGTGTGRVIATGIDCGSDCNQPYNAGTGVTLVALSGAGSRFEQWSVPACGASPECTVTMDANLTVQAQFGSHAPARPRADLNNDARADLVFRNADGRVAAWLMGGLTVLGSDEIFPAGTAWQVAHIADLDGDGKADLVWQNPDGRITVYLMDGLAATLKANLLPAGGGWTVTHAADLDGDGKADLLFGNTDGTAAAYLMDGVTVRSGLTLIGPGSGWSVAKAGDFDGDGKADLLWAHEDGRVAIWRMDGLAATSSAEILGPGTGWSVSHLADLDGDGKADIVWRNANGAAAAWLMNGDTVASGADIIAAGTGWRVVHTGDFDNDGKADLVWAHDDGRVAIWLMDGLGVKFMRQVLDAATGWSVKAVRDLDGDGRADLVWEHADGRAAAWLMNGAAVTNGTTLLGPGTGWAVTP